MSTPSPPPPPRLNFTTSFVGEGGLEIAPTPQRHGEGKIFASFPRNQLCTHQYCRPRCVLENFYQGLHNVSSTKGPVFWDCHEKIGHGVTKYFYCFFSHSIEPIIGELERALGVAFPPVLGTIYSRTKTQIFGYPQRFSLEEMGRFIEQNLDHFLPQKVGFCSPNPKWWPNFTRLFTASVSNLHLAWPRDQRIIQTEFFEKYRPQSAMNIEWFLTKSTGSFHVGLLFHVSSVQSQPRCF